MKQDKVHNTLKALYEVVYASIGYDFGSIDKVQDFYKNYLICSDAEDKIVNDFLNSKKLTKLQKQVIKSSYYIGCSPSNLKK